jgi:uncharacterized protein (DUF58 family)
MTVNAERGVYVTLDELIALQYKAKGFTFLPRQPIHSILAGRHASRMRGRGLDFEEIRGYLPGDDPRTIDWKVTARTQEPHIRVYTEERDRPAILVVDQRTAMFFGSVRSMKSVVAAQVAALGAWRVFASGDRVGAVVFNDSDIETIKAHRSRRNVLQILNAVVEMNRALSIDAKIRSNPEMLNRALDGVARIAKHDYLITIISDFDGMDEETTRLMTLMSQHNDMIVVPVFDPLSRRFPERGRLVVSDGELQLELDTEKGWVQQRITDVGDRRMKSIMKWWEELAVPVAPLTTDRDPIDQIQELLGSASRAGRQRR